MCIILLFLILDLELKFNTLLSLVSRLEFLEHNYFHNIASRVPGLKVLPLSSISICGNWLV